MRTEKIILNFDQFGLSDDITDIIRKGNTIITEIHSKGIPAILTGKDVYARAPTGSGKTMAYVLPMLQRIIDTYL